MTPTIPLLSTKGYANLWNLSEDHPEALYENRSSAELKELLEQSHTKKGGASTELWDGEIKIQAGLEALNEAEEQSDTTDASNAKILRAAFPGVTAAKAADHRLWASVNCFALLRYTTNRWNKRSSAKAPCSTTDVTKIREWVKEHYLGYGSNMLQNNAAARLWWQIELSERVAEYSRHDAERLLSAMANDVEMYHQLLSRPYLVSNPRLVAMIYDLALTVGNDYLLKRPYPNRMLQNLNLKAAAVSLSALSGDELRAVVDEAKPPKEAEDTN